MSTEQEDESVLRVLHTADWHLGRRFPNFPDHLQEKLTRARIDVLDRIFGVAERNAVDALLCAGDLFDDPLPEAKWWKELAMRLERRNWKNRPVFLLPGNHDPLLPDSIWAKEHAFRRMLPAWVHVVDASPFEYPLSDDAVLHAVPCRSKAGQADPTELIPMRQPGDERIRIGMVHGSTFDVKDWQTNFPISSRAAVERGLDYVAIGDTHGFRFVPEGQFDQPMVYPGTPEPTAFDEKEPGKVALVQFNRRRGARVHAETVAYWIWEEREVTSLLDLQELCNRADLGRRVLRLRVDMRLPIPEYEAAESLLEQLQGTDVNHGKVGVLSLDRAGLQLETATIEDHCQDLPPVLLSAMQRLKLLARDPSQAQIAERALVHLYQTTQKGA